MIVSLWQSIGLMIYSFSILIWVVFVSLWLSKKSEYKHNFARSYDEMKGIDPKFYRHHIQLQDDAKPIKQQQYRMNPNYVLWMNKGYW